MKTEEFLDHLVTSHANMVMAGMKTEREKLLPLFAAIFAAYDRAVDDPNVVISSPLMAAIVAARSVVEKL